MLKRKHEDLEALLQMLKSFPQQEADNLLTRIRSGIDPSILVEQVRHGSLLMSLSVQGSSNHSQDSSESPSYSS